MFNHPVPPSRNTVSCHAKDIGLTDSRLGKDKGLSTQCNSFNEERRNQKRK